MAEQGKLYRCPNCGCEVTIEKLPDDYGTFGSMEFGEGTFGGGGEPKCNFCQTEMQEVQ